MFKILLLAGILASSPAFAGDALTTGSHRFRSDGLSLWYRVAGSTHGVPVVYLHGGPAEGSQGLAHTSGPLLERKLRIVYFDQRGAGHSDRPDDASRYTMALIVGDIERLRRQLGVRKIDLLGHSYGSILALEYAARFPNHVSRMVLTGTVVDQPAATNLECRRLKAEDAEAYAKAVKAADRPGDPDCIPMEGVAGPARRAYFQRASGAGPDTLAKLDSSDTAEKVTMGGPAHIALADPEFHYRFDQISRLTMPILVIAGAKDRLADPEPVRPFVTKLNNGQMITYADAGHFLYVDDPTRFARDTIAFLQR